MANNQSVALLQAGEAQAALDAAAGTDAVFESEGDRLKMAMAIGNQAAALDALGRLEEAEGHYRRCAELLSQLGEEQMRAQVLQALSALQLHSGRQLEALASMQAGLDKLERPTMRQRLLKRLLSIPNKIFPK
jgi:tetratricopeptide (TPR) repeat protein